MTTVVSSGVVLHVPSHKPNTEDEDMKLARQLQEQERAYFLLSQGGYTDEGGQETRSGYYSEGSVDMRRSAGSAGMGEAAGATPATLAAVTAEEEEEEEFDDEAFARRLQEEEQRAVMSRLIAAQLGMAGGYSGEEEEQADEEALEDDTDPDQMTYEQLTALGEVVGTEQVGVSRSTLAALAEVTFVQTAGAGEEQCVICRVEFEDGEKLKLLPCKHQYHGECIEQWLNINKKCPTCSHELDVGECK